MRGDRRISRFGKRRMPAVSTAVAAIEERILTLRGQKVLLDSDLAALYGVSRKAARGAAEEPCALPLGFRVPAITSRGYELEIAICDLKFGARTRGKTLPPVRVYRAGNQVFSMPVRWLTVIADRTYLR